MTQVQTPPLCGIFYFFYRFPKQFKHLTSIVNIGAQHHPCGEGQVAKDPVPGQLCAGGGYGGGPRRRQGEPTSSFNNESSLGQILSSLQTVVSDSLPGSETGSPPIVISCRQLCLSLPARWLSRTWRHPCWLSPSASSLWLGLCGI